jgi:hypothetical protein
MGGDGVTWHWGADGVCGDGCTVELLAVVLMLLLLLIELLALPDSAGLDPVAVSAALGALMTRRGVVVTWGVEASEDRRDGVLSAL